MTCVAYFERKIVLFILSHNKPVFNPFRVIEVHYFGFRKKKKKEPVSMARLDDIERFLHKKPRMLERSDSMLKIPRQIERELRVSRYEIFTKYVNR